MKTRKLTPDFAQEINKKKYSLPRNRSPELKPLFLERMQKLLPDKKDFENYLNILKISPVKSIRCNTLKISPKELKKKLEEKAWKITSPWKNYPEIMIVEGKEVAISEEVESLHESSIALDCECGLECERSRFTGTGRENRKKPLRLFSPGEIGRALEHLLGYYYIQELASMLPIIALAPQQDEIILDLCSAPGSKTTQASSEMNNTGTIIANEISLGRIKILASNLERCGVANTIITKKDGIVFCKKMKKEGMNFDKILIDAPCSGEGTLRSTSKTYSMWNIKTVKNLSKMQKNLVASALEILKPNGELVYSTCTHSPEENEEVVDFILKEFKGKIKLEKIKLPVKAREGIVRWQDKTYLEEVKKCARIYPQDNNTEGFFLAKFKKLKK